MGISATPINLRILRRKAAIDICGQRKGKEVHAHWLHDESQSQQQKLLPPGAPLKGCIKPPDG